MFVLDADRFGEAARTSQFADELRPADTLALALGAYALARIRLA